MALFYSARLPMWRTRFDVLGWRWTWSSPGGHKEILSWMTNSALVNESPCGWREGDCGVSANEYSCSHHVTWSPNKLWRTNSIFNLWSSLSIVVTPTWSFLLAWWLGSWKMLCWCLRIATRPLIFLSLVTIFWDPGWVKIKIRDPPTLKKLFFKLNFLK
jgi:hypothetical protein